MFWMCNIGNLILALGLFLEADRDPARCDLDDSWIDCLVCLRGVDRGVCFCLQRSRTLAGLQVALIALTQVEWIERRGVGPLGGIWSFNCYRGSSPLRRST